MRIFQSYDRRDYNPAWPRTVNPSARAIISVDGKYVLIFSGKYGIYSFPGGRVEPGETVVDALVRETSEETGLTVIPHAYRQRIRYSNGNKKRFIQR